MNELYINIGVSLHQRHFGAYCANKMKASSGWTDV